ncbi:MAG: FeoA domain-containing protein, partial [Methanophagales archaeon]|nr:FeoA domain-containing protein [Methanophagales archaeon]
MKLLSKVEPEVKVAVKKIDGGLEVKRHLEELGFAEGTELTVVATEPVHVHVGPISLKAAGR